MLLNALRSGEPIAEAATQTFKKTKLKAGEQADLVRESFALACELGWLCLHRDSDRESTLVVM